MTKLHRFIVPYPVLMVSLVLSCCIMGGIYALYENQQSETVDVSGPVQVVGVSANVSGVGLTLTFEDGVTTYTTDGRIIEQLLNAPNDPVYCVRYKDGKAWWIAPPTPEE